MQQSLRSAALFPAGFCFSLRLRVRSDRKRTEYIHIYTYTRTDTPCRSLPPSAVPQRSRGPAPGGSWPYGTCGTNVRRDPARSVPPPPSPAGEEQRGVRGPFKAEESLRGPASRRAPLRRGGGGVTWGAVL